MPTPNRILLTGTPVQNKFSELFCMLNFVRPHIWKKEKFKKLFEEPINKGSSRDASSHEVLEFSLNFLFSFLFLSFFYYFFINYIYCLFLLFIIIETNNLLYFYIFFV